MSSKDAHRMTNIVDPDQTAPLEIKEQFDLGLLFIDSFFLV